MLTLRHSLAAFTLSLGMIFAPLSAQAADKPFNSQIASEADTYGLFVNLTTDDTWAAAKAIMFAHEKVLKTGHDPVVIWLNVRGIYHADKNRPSHIHGLMAEQGTSIQDMLQAFIADGGIVIACGACSQAAGLTEEDYIDGVVKGSESLVQGYLFDPKVKTLSW